MRVNMGWSCTLFLGSLWLAAGGGTDTNALSLKVASDNPV